MTVFMENSVQHLLNSAIYKVQQISTIQRVQWLILKSFHSCYMKKEMGDGSSQPLDWIVEGYSGALHQHAEEPACIMVLNIFCFC